MSKLLPHQERLIERNKQLVESAVGLRKFIAGKVFPTLSEAEQLDMQTQLIKTEETLTLVISRVSRFAEPVVPA